MRHRRDILVVVERGVEAGGRFEEMRDHLFLFGAVHPPLLHRHVGSKGRKNRELAGEGLGRGDADFRPGMGREQQVGFARHRTCRHVDDHRDGLPVRLAVPQGRQRIGRLAALADEQGQPALFQHRLAIAELGRDIDIDRNAREMFEPVFGDQPGVERRAAGDDRHAANGRQVEIELGQRNRIVGAMDVGGERLRHHGRLLEDLLLHEVAVIALLRRRCGCAGSGYCALDRIVLVIVDLRAFAADHDPVAFLEIGNLLRQRGQRQRIGAEKGLVLAIADHQRRAETRADQHVGMGAKGDRQREGTAQARKDGLDRILRARPVLDLAREKMGDHFGVGVALQRAALAAQFGAQFLVVLDDAVVHYREVLGRVRVGILLVRGAVSRPAGMRDPDCARRGAAIHLLDQIGELALRTAAYQIAVMDGAHARAVVAAIFHPPEAVDEPIGDRAATDDTDDSAHGRKGPGFTLFEISAALARNPELSTLRIAQLGPVGPDGCLAGERAGVRDHSSRPAPMMIPAPAKVARSGTSPNRR